MTKPGDALRHVERALHERPSLREIRLEAPGDDALERIAEIRRVPGSASSPVRSSSTSSGTPESRVATTGTPDASASIRTTGRPSI